MKRWLAGALVLAAARASANAHITLEFDDLDPPAQQGTTLLASATASELEDSRIDWDFHWTAERREKLWHTLQDLVQYRIARSSYVSIVSETFTTVYGIAWKYIAQ